MTWQDWLLLILIFVEVVSLFQRILDSGMRHEMSEAVKQLAVNDNFRFEWEKRQQMYGETIEKVKKENERLLNTISYLSGEVENLKKCQPEKTEA